MSLDPEDRDPGTLVSTASPLCATRPAYLLIDSTENSLGGLRSTLPLSWGGNRSCLRTEAREPGVGSHDIELCSPLACKSTPFQGTLQQGSLLIELCTLDCRRTHNVSWPVGENIR